MKGWSDTLVGMADNDAEPAVRLTLTADDEGVRVLERRRLSKRLPPSDLFAESGGNDASGSPPQRSGFWVEVRDRADRVRYRRVLADPLVPRIEVSNGDGTFTNQPAAGPVTFSVLVPDLADGEEVVLVRDTPTAASLRSVTTVGPRRATGELARLSLRTGEGR